MVSQRKSQRQHDAQVRKNLMLTTTAAEQLQKLDARLGRNQGAQKERARLQAIIHPIPA
jgi:hypothetical protein